MSDEERRIWPRKACALPLRFRVLVKDVKAAVAAEQDSDPASRQVPVATRSVMEGEVLNLSERGVFFRSKERVSIGTALEMFFTLPRELTGRSPEEIRCNARVVHIRHSGETEGFAGIGARVEHFEPIRARSWAN